MSIAKLGWALSSGLSDTLTQILNLLANKQSSIQLKTTFMSPTTIIWTQNCDSDTLSDAVDHGAQMDQNKHVNFCDQHTPKIEA